jgi:hypothetical protein
MCFERGDCERVKRRLHWMCCRCYPFIFLEGIKEGLFVLPISGEPCISVSLLYYVLLCYIFTFILICFIFIAP